MIPPVKQKGKKNRERGGGGGEEEEEQEEEAPQNKIGLSVDWSITY